MAELVRFAFDDMQASLSGRSARLTRTPER
jgi:hypothetical protein